MPNPMLEIVKPIWSRLWYRPNFVMMEFDDYMNVRPQFGYPFPKFSYSVPSDDALAFILNTAGGRPIIEVCSGRGYWAHCLSEQGASITATDLDPPENCWVSVERESSVIAGRYPHSLLLVVWPPRNESAGVDGVRAFVEAGGRDLVLVGDHEIVGDAALESYLRNHFTRADRMWTLSWCCDSDPVVHWVRS